MDTIKRLGLLSIDSLVYVPTPEELQEAREHATQLQEKMIGQEMRRQLNSIAREQTTFSKGEKGKLCDKIERLTGVSIAKAVKRAAVDVKRGVEAHLEERLNVKSSHGEVRRIMQKYIDGKVEDKVDSKGKTVTAWTRVTGMLARYDRESIKATLVTLFSDSTDHKVDELRAEYHVALLLTDKPAAAPALPESTDSSAS